MSTEVCSIVVPVLQDPAIFDLFLGSLWETIEVPSQVILLNEGCGNGIDDVIDGHEHHLPACVRLERRSSATPRGSGRALNDGLTAVAGDVVVFADSDLILLHGWQSALLEALRQPEVGCAGAVLTYPQTGGVQHCGLAFTEDIGRHLFLNAQVDDIPEDVYTAQAVVFALCAIPTPVIRRVGRIDEAYFNGYEDLDYQMRIRRLGLRIVVQPRARAHHWERSSGPHRQANRKRNLGRFWRQWGSAIYPDLEQHLVRRLVGLVGRETTFRAIDLCCDRPDAERVWAAVRGELSLTTVDDVSHLASEPGELWLPRALGIDGHRTTDRLLFLVDNFVQLLGNRYWLERRAAVRDDDVAIDLYANALAIQRLRASCWPGTKIR